MRKRYFSPLDLKNSSRALLITELTDRLSFKANSLAFFKRSFEILQEWANLDHHIWGLLNLT